MKAHCYYHDQLVAKKIDFIKPDGTLNYPCLGSFSKIFSHQMAPQVRLFENFWKSVINRSTIIAVIRNIKMNFMPNSNSLVDFQIAIIEDNDSIELIIGKISTPILDFTAR